MSIIQNIISRAKSDKKKIVLPECTDIRTIKAAVLALEKEIADIVLVGNQEEIIKLAGDLNISNAIIVDHLKSPNFDLYADEYYELRKSKGLTLEQAKETLRNPLHFASMMVRMGEADGMVAGAINSTGDVILSAVRIVQSKENKVSSFFLMEVPECEYGYDGIFLYADSGVIPNPNASELADIALASADSFKLLVNAEPKVAMLSYSTYGSAKSDLTEKVVEAVKITKTKSTSPYN